MTLGMVGLPNVGKSTIFSAIMRTAAKSGSYPFSTIEPETGRVAVPDARLDGLARMFGPKEVVPGAIEIIDIAGLIKGSNRGEGLGSQFLAHIREVDAIAHVVRVFEDENVVNVGRGPVDDIECVNLELILSDLEIVQRRLEKAEKAARTDKSLQKDVDLLTRIKAALDSGQPASVVSAEGPEEVAFLRAQNLITSKPVLFVANIGEEHINTEPPGWADLQKLADACGAGLVALCAKPESEANELDCDERAEFLAEMGIAHSGADRFVLAAHDLLNLCSFFTVNANAARAWAIPKGTKVAQAAGKVHTDMERGFIRAEVIPYDTLMSFESMAAAKQSGAVRIEGRTYEVCDGDVIFVRFNV